MNVKGEKEGADEVEAEVPGLSHSDAAIPIRSKGPPDTY